MYICTYMNMCIYTTFSVYILYICIRTKYIYALHNELSVSFDMCYNNACMQMYMS